MSKALDEVLLYNRSDIRITRYRCCRSHSVSPMPKVLGWPFIFDNNGDRQSTPFIAVDVLNLRLKMHGLRMEHAPTQCRCGDQRKTGQFINFAHVSPFFVEPPITAPAKK